MDKNTEIINNRDFDFIDCDEPVYIIKKSTMDKILQRLNIEIIYDIQDGYNVIVDICDELKGQGIDPFEFDCYELSKCFDKYGDKIAKDQKK